MRTMAWMNKICMLLVAVFTVSINLVHAQNAPITSIASTGGGIPGQQVIVPVIVSGFINIGSFTLALNYNNSDLQYVSGAQNPLLSGNAVIGDHDLGNGMHRLVMSWFGNAEYIPDGEFLINLTFVFNNGPGSLEWYDNGPSCVYTDDNANLLNDSPTTSFYVNGIVCSAVENPGDISGLNALCQGQTSIGYSISPILNVSGYEWSVPEGSIIASGDGTNSIVVDYSQNSVSGDVSVSGFNECGNGPVSVLAITVYPQPTAAAGNDTIILYGTTAQLHASNAGTGTFSYHWSPEALLVDPNVQHPVTVPLTSSALFVLEVTEVSGLCESTDEVAVSISGGPLSVVPSVVPGMICRDENAQLYSNAGGGSGDYLYVWTSEPAGNPAWTSTLANPVVSPETSTIYHLSVSDGYNTLNGSTSLTVNQLPTAFMSGGGVVCDDGSQLIIRIDLSGTPPWSFSYSNGLNVIEINNVFESPFFISTAEPGLYSVIELQDMYCEGTSSGSAYIELMPVPPTPFISVTGFTLSSDAISGNQWYRNDQPIEEANEQAYIASESGRYYDLVTLDGCTSDTSNCIDLVVTHVRAIHDQAFRLFPNPAGDYVILEYITGFKELSSVSIFASNGIQISDVKTIFRASDNVLVIDTKSLTPGVYFLRIKTGIALEIMKLLIL